MKSPCVPISFGPARESILTLFDPIMALKPYLFYSKLLVAEFEFVSVYTLFFSGK